MIVRECWATNNSYYLEALIKSFKNNTQQENNTVRARSKVANSVESRQAYFFYYNSFSWLVCSNSRRRLFRVFQVACENLMAWWNSYHRSIFMR